MTKENTKTSLLTALEFGKTGLMCLTALAIGSMVTLTGLDLSMSTFDFTKEVYQNQGLAQAALPALVSSIFSVSTYVVGKGTAAVVRSNYKKLKNIVEGDSYQTRLPSPSLG